MEEKEAIMCRMQDISAEIEVVAATILSLSLQFDSDSCSKLSDSDNATIFNDLYMRLSRLSGEAREISSPVMLMEVSE